MFTQILDINTMIIMVSVLAFFAFSPAVVCGVA